MSRYRRIVVSLVVLGALFVTVFATAQNVSAATSERSTQLNAIGDVEGCETTDQGEVCTTINVEALNPSKLGGAAVCVAVTTTDAAGESIFEEGCADASGSFAIDQDRLETASISPLSVDLYTTVCEGKTCDFVYSRTVTVAANWVGDGTRVRVHERQYGHQPSCEEIITFRGWVRDAALTVSFNEQTLSGRGNLQVIESIRRCR
jgi:hypothetical protein